jgi:cytoskeleton protein RodZ
MATVMVSVGSHLRELRTRRGMALEEIARLTRVPARYLIALENDALSELPAPVFIRGFIRAYCQALGESPLEALTIYDGHAPRALGAPVRTAAPLRSAPPEPRTRGTLAVSFILLVILGMALFTVTLVIRPGDRLERPTADIGPAQPSSPAAGSQGETAPSAPTGVTAAPSPVPTQSAPAVSRPAASPAPAASVTARVVPRPADPSPPRTPSPEAVASRPTAVPNLEEVVGTVISPYRLIAKTTESTWIRVRTQDGRSSDETVPAGEIREWVSDRPFVVTVGNAGGVSLELNGRTLPPLGASGVVIPRLVLPPESR